MQWGACRVSGIWEFPSDSDKVPTVSAAAKAMIRAAMTVDRRERLGADELLLHPWLQGCQDVGKHSVSSVAVTEDLMPQSVDAVRLSEETHTAAEATPPLPLHIVTESDASKSHLSRNGSDESPKRTDTADVVAEGTPPTNVTSEMPEGRPPPSRTHGLPTTEPSRHQRQPEPAPETEPERKCEVESEVDLSSSDDDEFEECRADF